MYFTQEDYKKIENWLHRNSVKDTEFQEALPFTGKEIVTIVQDGHNRKVNIQEFINQLYKHGVEDFLNVTNTYGANNITLKEAIRLIPAEARKEGQVITFLNTDGNWEIYQFTGKLNQWNNTTLWNNPFDWGKFVVDSILPDEEDLTKSEPDAKGNSYLSLKDRKYEPDKYSGLGRKILRRRVVEIEDPIYGTQEKNLLLQADFAEDNTVYVVRYDFTLNGQDITLPDNSYIEYEGGSISDGNIIDIAKGLNRVILRKNIKEGKNILTQDMINKENTIYEIRYDFDLNNQIITIPENCILKFEGGTIKKGTITFTDTTIVAKTIAFSDVEFKGAIANNDIDVKVFGAGNHNLDNTSILNNIFSFGVYNAKNFIFHKETYNINGSLELWFGYETRCSIIGNGATLLQKADNIPTLICHECCSIDNIKINYKNEQPTENTRAIAISYSRLVYSTIKNISIINANTCFAPVIDSETQYPTTDRSMVNCVIETVNTWQISGYFVSFSAGGLHGLTSGTYFNNIYFGITHYNNANRNTAIAFCKLVSNCQVAIGELNIEGGKLQHIIEPASNACVTIQTLHLEGIELTEYFFDINNSCSILIDDFNIDYKCKSSSEYSTIFSLGEGAFVSVGRLKINSDFKVNTSMFIVIPQVGNSICTIGYLQNNSNQNIQYLHPSATGICKLLINSLEYPFIASTSNIPKAILYAGRSFWNTSINRLGYYINNNWVDTDNYPLNKKTGTSDERPTITDELIGFQYFDTDLNKPIYACKKETFIKSVSTGEGFEYNGSNDLIVGDVYTLKATSGQGSKFGYKTASYAIRDQVNFSTNLTFIAKDYPFLYITSNAPSSTFSISKVEYVWVDANGNNIINNG